MSDYFERKRVVKECKRYIETHLYDDVDFDDLAEIMHISSMSIRRYFEEVGGYSVHGYSRLRRIHMAGRALRRGEDVAKAFKSSGFKSMSGFTKAFTEIFGVSPWAFAKTRGMDLMEEPQIMKRSAFNIVGYMFEGTAPIKWEDHGAYYIIQDFPNVSEREWERIGGGAEMIGTWMEKNGTPYYIFGPGVDFVQYIPVPLGTLYVPGGDFAVFPAPKPMDSNDSTVICENIQITWYYALEQWLPDSDYLLDKTRIPYEYYLNGNNLVCVPIIPKIKPKPKPQKRKKKQPQGDTETTE